MSSCLFLGLHVNIDWHDLLIIYAVRHRGLYVWIGKWID